MISTLLKNDESTIEEYFSCYQEPINKSIKIITHKISQENFFALAKNQSRQLTSPGFINNSDTYYIAREDHKVWLGKHWLHSAWFFYMQEVAASLPAHILPLKAWDVVLDMCAAPGWKSVQIWDALLQLGWGWYVVSNEMSWSRIISLQHNLNRTWIYNSCVTNMSWSLFGGIAPNFFDGVLVDAPCSGEWTGFKSDAGTKRWREDLVHKIARVQKDLLTSAVKACKPWGYILYATCTINPWENEWVISHILEQYGDYLTLENVEINHKSPWVTKRADQQLLSPENAEKVARFWPHIQHTGWFFIALLHKTQETPHTDKPVSINETLSQLDISDTLQEKMHHMIWEDYGIDLIGTDYFFASTPKQIYITTKTYATLHSKMHIAKIWVPVFKWNNNKELRPLHGLWTILGHLATKNVIQLDDTSVQKYSEWYDLTVDYKPTTPHSYVMLQYAQRWFSVWKIVWDTLKNKFIK